MAVQVVALRVEADAALKAGAAVRPLQTLLLLYDPHAFKDDRLLYHSTPGLRVMKKEKEDAALKAGAAVRPP